jgi:hypothetical protein
LFAVSSKIAHEPPGGAKGDPLTVQKLQKLLNLLPNLEALDLAPFRIEIGSLDEPIKWDLKSTKIQRVKIYDCIGLESLLESLEKCAIRDLELSYSYPSQSEPLKKFLRVQEKNLKKLTLSNALEFNLLDDLKDLRLEHFELHACYELISFDFLRHQLADVRFLILIHSLVSVEYCNRICELKNLETLELDGCRMDDNSGLDNLQKLKQLKCLNVDKNVSKNILDHMKFGVFKDL